MRCLGCMAEYKDEYGLCPYCGYEPGTAAESSLHIQPGVILAGRYLIGRVIGYGGFGVTYIGWDTTLQQRVAIKEYLPSEFATRAVGQTQVTVFGGNKAEQFSGGMVKFVDEAKRLARFQNEPGIVRVFDSFEANNTAYIVMEYLDGETLTSYLKREGKIPVEQAVDMLAPVIRSLEVVHKAGIIHRDIAPDNIILTKDGQAKLIDFGAARYATTSHSRSLTVIIKPGYSPEEQYRSRGDQGSHTDVYALAAVLYRMVTGVTPPDALERRAFYENKKKDILPPLSQNCKIGKNRENAILNAMNVRVEDRTKTANDFLSELTSETRVRRLAGKIKAIDLMKWPLWAKIVVPTGFAAVVALFALLLTGVISFSGNLVTDFALGADMTRVPSVINCSVGVAQDKLEAQKLVSVIAGREISDTIPANMVLRQSVDAGGVVQKGSSVELYVSAASEPVAGDGTMPDVAFYSVAEAKAMLTQLGAVVYTEEEYSNDIAEGIVIRASVGYGEPLAEGDEIILYVSKGPDPEASTGEDDPEDSETGATVKLNRSSLSLFVDESVSLTAGGGNGSFNWSSSNSSVVSVKNGSVTAVGKGSAIITVTSDGKSATCSVTVQDYSISLSESYLSLFVGDSSTLSVLGAPSGANISWSSSKTGVATVSGGRVTAVATGSATITAQFTNNGRTYSAACQVNVSSTGIKLSQYSITDFYVGDSVSLTASTSPGGQRVSWSSSNSSVATVSSSGKVTAEGVGSATITASFAYGGQTYSESCSVRVYNVSISVSNSSITLMVGDSEYLSASTYPGGKSISWSSSDTSVATVDSNGRVTAVGNGSATITATMLYNGNTYSDTCSVKVKTPYVDVYPSTLSLHVGKTGTLQRMTGWESFSSLDWNSSDTSVASVENISADSVTIRAIGPGEATITGTVVISGKTYTASCHVTVLDEDVSVSLSQSSLSLTAGDSATLSASATPSGASLSWSSSDTSVATVSGSGYVSAVGEGSATITVTAKNDSKTASASCSVTVQKAESTLGFYSMNVPSGSISFGSYSVGGCVASNYELHTINYGVNDLNKELSTMYCGVKILGSGQYYSYSLTDIICELMGYVTYPGTFSFWFSASDASGKEVEYSTTFTIS